MVLVGQPVSRFAVLLASGEALVTATRWLIGETLRDRRVSVKSKEQEDWG